MTPNKENNEDRDAILAAFLDECPGAFTGPDRRVATASPSVRRRHYECDPACQHADVIASASPSTVVAVR